MRVLLTGGTGFIGSHLIRELLQADHEVVALSRSGALPAELELPNDDPRLRVVEGDLLDAASLPPALDGCDAVAHLAGFISTLPQDRQRVYDLNHAITTNLWEAVAAHGRIDKVLYLASIFALAGGRKGDVVTEDHPYNLDGNPIDYFRAKRRAELDTWQRVEAGALPATFVYPCFCLGPGDARLSSSQLLWLYLNMPVPMSFAGSLNLMDVRDAAWGLRLGLERGVVGERTIVGGVNLSFAEAFAAFDEVLGFGRPRFTLPGPLAALAGALAERMGQGELLDRQAAWIANRHWLYSSDKATRDWGYRPRALAETVAEAARWFATHGMVKSPARKAKILQRTAGQNGRS